MPRPKIALSRRIVALLSGAAAVQLGIIGGLGYVHYENSRLARKADNARAVGDGISILVSELYSIVSDDGAKKLLQMGENAPSLTDSPQSIYKQYANLKALLKDNPHQLAIITRSERGTLEAMAILQQLKEMRDRGELFNRIERKPMVMSLARLRDQIVSTDMLSLAEYERGVASRAPAKQADLRRISAVLLAVDGVVTILIFLGLGAFFLRRVAYRLEHVIAGSEDLLDEIPLSLPIKPKREEAEGDEIARLSQRLNELAGLINQISAKQVAAVDNALDMICTLSEEGHITAANAAAGKLIGSHPTELLGKNFRTITHRSDAGAVAAHLQSIRLNGNMPNLKPIEVRVITRQRRSVPVQWTSQWSEADKQFFIVVHNVAELTEARRMKQEVLDIINNDLQGPVVNLQAFLDLLEEGSIAEVSDKGKRFILSARRQTNQMLMLINDMLDLQKANGGLLVLQAETLDLDKIIDQAQVEVAPYAEQKNVILDCRRSGLKVRGEEDKLRRVLTNLLSNAVEQTAVETSILLQTILLDGMAQVSITDKGPGLPPDKLATLFKYFHPQENADIAGNTMTSLPAVSDAGAIIEPKPAGAGSSGLAMALCKAFVELQGGKIVASSPVGEGTIIRFTIPVVNE